MDTSGIIAENTARRSAGSGAGAWAGQAVGSNEGVGSGGRSEARIAGSVARVAATVARAAATTARAGAGQRRSPDGGISANDAVGAGRTAATRAGAVAVFFVLGVLVAVSVAVVFDVSRSASKEGSRSGQNSRNELHLVVFCLDALLGEGRQFIWTAGMFVCLY